LCLQISPHDDVTLTSLFGSWFHVYQHIYTGMHILMLEICWYHFNKLTLKLQIKMFSANLIFLCNHVSLIAQSKFYFQKPAIVEILTTNLRGYFLLGHSVLIRQAKLDVVLV